MSNGGVFRLPASSDKKFREWFEGCIGKEVAIGGKGITMENFNVRLDEQKEWDTKLLKQVEKELCLTQMVREFTRIAEKSKSMIDLPLEWGSETLSAAHAEN